jgi:hypothetical protein
MVMLAFKLQALNYTRLCGWLPTEANIKPAGMTAMPDGTLYVSAYY